MAVDIRVHEPLFHKHVCTMHTPREADGRATLLAMGFDPIAYINEPRWQKVSLGLARMRLLCDELGNPERMLRFVHVAGTNGKGSTCAYLDAICRAARLKCGLFTSPYIERFEERIRVDGHDIPSPALARCTLRVKEAALAVERTLGEHPTEFELMCAVALVHFAHEACDICILEVGLGGRLDATNVIHPDLCAITRIGLDHTALLGETLEQIAQEKAGIIKEGVPCTSSTQAPAARAVIQRICEAKGCPLTVVDPTCISDAHLTYNLTRTFSYQGERFETSLLGAYQPENAALAIVSARILEAHGWPISESSIHTGIAEATWTGRFEVLRDRPWTIVDGAHNEDGSAALSASLQEMQALTDVRDPVFVIGVLADKDVRAIIEPHIGHARTFYVYEPENPRALPAAALADLISSLDPNADIHICAHPVEAMDAALKKATPEGMVVAFGSLYSIAALRRAALGH